ncbi:MAG: DUF4340 domain-containing protein [Chloroflexi bacterium]|nr:DUF4340 domain-containing protein [Chloroflexota bacterium]
MVAAALKERRSMNFKTTLAVLVVLVVLGAAVYLYELRPGSPGASSVSTPSTSPAPLWTLDRNDIKSFQIQDSTISQTSAIERTDNNQWKIVKPFPLLEADQTRLEGIVIEVTSITPSRVITENVANPEDFGVAKPDFEFQMETKDGRQFSLHFSKQNPGGTGYYVQPGGSKAVYLVSLTTIDELRRLISEPPIQPTPTIEAVGTGTAITPTTGITGTVAPGGPSVPITSTVPVTPAH